MSRTGVEQAKLTVKETLENVTAVSNLIPSSGVRGSYDLIHVYSSKTNSTVSLRVLPDGKQNRGQTTFSAEQNRGAEPGADHVFCDVFLLTETVGNRKR